VGFAPHTPLRAQRADRVTRIIASTVPTAAANPVRGMNGSQPACKKNLRGGKKIVAKRSDFVIARMQRANRGYETGRRSGRFAASKYRR
jgi:hypothetical protein